MTVLSHKQINIIYHLADIHIRPLERHEEYREVFQNLYIYLKNDKDINNSLVVICGDLVHEKDKITPELIILLREFLKELSSITDVIIFSGNHDLIENNSDRTANLEALTQDLNNIFYLKYTDLYEYGNIIFSLNSLEDNKDFIKMPATNKIKIALYHGMLKEISFSKNSISVENFKDYNFVLLGDVHERQFLKDNIAYSGSLIQQNFGETLNEHGLIKWDIINKKSECVDIENDYGFVTITNNIINELPKNSRIRINLTNETEVKQLLNEIKKKTNIISEKTIKFKNEDDKIEYEEEFIENISDEDIIKGQVSEDKYDELIKLHDTIKLECNFNKETISEYKWSIQNIEFKNLFIYGNNVINKISFNDKLGVIGILGKNAIGKSSIINIIIFALFDKISSEFNSINVINKNCKNMYIKVEFTIGNILYIIEKQGSLQKKKIGQKTKYTTNYKKIENEKEINLNGKDRIRTQQLIEETIGIRDIFLLCNVVSNTNITSILNMTNSNIIQMFSSLLYLDKYDKLFKNISSKIKELNEQLLKQQGIHSIYSSNTFEEVDDLKSNLKKKLLDRSKSKNKLEILEKMLKEIQNEFNNVTSKIILVEKPNEDIKDLLARKNELNESINSNYSSDYTVNETLEELYKNYHIMNDNLKESKDKFSKLDTCYKKYTESELQELQMQYKIKKEDLNKNKKNIAMIKLNKNGYNISYEKLIQMKDKCKLKYIEKKKVIQEIDIEHISHLNKIIKDCEDILFYNCNKISEECQRFKKILINKSFYLNESNTYDTLKMDELLKDMTLFFSKVKTETELNTIRTQLNKDKNELNKLLNLKNINEKAIIHNQEIKESLKYNKSITEELSLINHGLDNIRYKELEKNINELSIEINSLSLKINEVNKSIEYFKFKDLINKLERNVKIDKKIKYIQFMDEIQVINEKIIKFQKYKENYKNNLKFEEIKNNIEKTKLECNNELNLNKEILTRLDTEILYDQKMIDKKETDLNKKLENEKIMNALNETLELYDDYKKLVDKKCIPSILLKEKLSFIEKDINSKLDGLVKFKINMYIDENLKFNLDIVKNENILKPYMCSGYERFILNVMIKNSLNRYCYNNKSNIFCIDEGLDCIDDDNLKKFKIVLERLQKTYNHILLISQIDRINKYIDHQILIEHSNNCSFIK